MPRTAASLSAIPLRARAGSPSSPFPTMCRTCSCPCGRPRRESRHHERQQLQAHMEREKPNPRTEGSRTIQTGRKKNTRNCSGFPWNTANCRIRTTSRQTASQGKTSAGTYERQPEIPDLRQNARSARPVGLRLARFRGRAERHLPDDTPLRSLRRLRERAEADTTSYRRKSNEPGQARKCTQPSIRRQRSVQTTG